VFTPKRFWTQLCWLVKGLAQKRVWGWALFALGIGLGPVLTSFLETTNYLSPSRGFSKGQIAVGHTGYQTSTGALPASYSNLWSHPFQEAEIGFDHLTDTHEPVFIGLWVLVFLPLALTSERGRALLTAAFLVAWLGAGEGHGLWEWAQLHLPGFGLVRHGFTFGRLAGFAVLLAGLEGLLQFCNDQRPWTQRLALSFLGAWLAWPLFMYLQRGGNLLSGRASGINYPVYGLPPTGLSALVVSAAVRIPFNRPRLSQRHPPLPSPRSLRPRPQLPVRNATRR